MIDLQTLSIVLACASVSIAALYYSFTLRYTRLNMKNTLETRQLDIYMKWLQELIKPDMMQKFNEVLQLEWEDFDDFRRKYDHTVNPEDSAKRLATWSYFSGLGYLLSRGMIDADTVHEMLINVGALAHWIKFEPIIKAYRKHYGRPELWEWFEYLMVELKKVRERRGLAEYVLPDRPE